MTLNVTGYQEYTGQSLSVWASGNTSFFSGTYVDLTGLDQRLFELDLEMERKVDRDTTYSDFASVQATFRSQFNQRISSVESTLKEIERAIVAIRRTLNDYNTRIAALE